MQRLNFVLQHLVREWGNLDDLGIEMVGMIPQVS